MPYQKCKKLYQKTLTFSSVSVRMRLEHSCLEVGSYYKDWQLAKKSKSVLDNKNVVLQIII